MFGNSSEGMKKMHAVHVEGLPLSVKRHVERQAQNQTELPASALLVLGPPRDSPEAKRARYQDGARQGEEQLVGLAMACGRIWKPGQ